MLRRLIASLLVTVPVPLAAQDALVLQTDFGLSEGSVAEMKGVAFTVSRTTPVFDLTHNIPPFDIFEAAVRLRQAMPSWPAGTVFVSVVDPGVGTSRRAVVARTRTGHIVVTPDNGTLTLVSDVLGITDLRQIDEKRHRLPGSERSHTFHGRDVFVYVGAMLASGQLSFDSVGAWIAPAPVRLPYKGAVREGQVLHGAVIALDRPYGNLWTNIPAALVDEAGYRLGDTVRVVIRQGGLPFFEERVPYVASFGAVAEDRPLVYLHSLLEVALALNMRDFAARYGVKPGATVEIAPPR
jgi:hypothetical protein